MLNFAPSRSAWPYREVGIAAAAHAGQARGIVNLGMGPSGAGRKRGTRNDAAGKPIDEIAARDVVAHESPVRLLRGSGTFRPGFQQIAQHGNFRSDRRVQRWTYIG